MTRPNDKNKIIEHYDVVSPFYRSLWDEHLHHGYWIRGEESKEKAQLQLTEYLAQIANIKPGSEILDIGWGFGASSLYLTKRFNASVTGSTISSVQVEMASQAAVGKGLLLMDAEAMAFQNGSTSSGPWNPSPTCRTENASSLPPRSFESRAAPSPSPTASKGDIFYIFTANVLFQCIKIIGFGSFVSVESNRAKISMEFNLRQM